MYLPNAFRVSDWPGLQTRPSGLPMRRVLQLIRGQQSLVTLLYGDDSTGVIDVRRRMTRSAVVGMRRCIDRSGPEAEQRAAPSGANYCKAYGPC